MPKPAFAFYGSKARYTEIILQHLKPHHTYVELFGGAGSVLLAKDPAPVEIYNDVFSGLTHFYSIIRNEFCVKELVRRLRLTPYSREEYYQCLHAWQDCEDPIEKARMWYFVQTCSFNGRFGAGLRHSATATSNGQSSFTHAYRAAVESIFEVAERFSGVIVENKDFAEIVKRYDTSRTCFYADPPYIMETRSKGRKYLYELDTSRHKELVELALTSKGSWVISGYAHEVYAPLQEARWQVVTFDVTASSAAYNNVKDKSRTEVLWVSP